MEIRFVQFSELNINLHLNAWKLFYKVVQFFQAARKLCILLLLWFVDRLGQIPIYLNRALSLFYDNN